MAAAFPSTCTRSELWQSIFSETASSIITNGNVDHNGGLENGSYSPIKIPTSMVALTNRSNKAMSMANNMVCDKCRQTPGSLSEFHTLPCMHTLCRKCFQPSGIQQVPAALQHLNCPICSIVGGGTQEEGNAEGTAMSTSTSVFHGFSPFSLYSSLGAISGREQLPSPAFGPIVSTYSAIGAQSATSTTASSYNLSEQLNVDTSLLIGNLLDSVSLNDDVRVKNVKATPGERFPSMASTPGRLAAVSSSLQLLQRPSASSSFAADPAASFRQSPRLHPVRPQAQDQLFSLAVGSQRPILGSVPVMQQQQPTPQRPLKSTSSSSPSTIPPACSICLDGVEAACRCEDCVEYLCTMCVQAHLRVRLTKDHRITSLRQPQPQPLPHTPISTTYSSAGSPGFTNWISGRSLDHQETSGRSNPSPAMSVVSAVPSTTETSSSSRQHRAPVGFCIVHRFEPLSFYCETCAELLCKFCTANVAAHPVPAHRISAIPLDRGQGVGDSQGTRADSGSLNQLFTDARHCVRILDEAIRGVDHMTERVETRMHSVANEVRAIIHHHIGALEERKRELLERVDAVRMTKLGALNSQKEELRKYLVLSKNALDQAEKILKSHPDADEDIAGRVRNILRDQLQLLSSSRPGLQPQEDDQLSFSLPDASVLKTVRLLGNVVTGAYAANCTLLGDALRRAVKDKPIYYTVQARDHVGESLTCGGDQVNGFVVTTSSPGESSAATVPSQLDVFDKRNGTYTCRYEPKREGEYQVHIFVRGRPIRGSPFKLIVSRGRDYTSIGASPVLSFGGEGTGDGQLCRPWGICCDKQGRIIVADRSNSRIQIFDQEGRFLHKFGSPGCRNGQFDRPAGVAVNSKNHIHVVDKDNHRVQVFTFDGQFLFKFGEKGRGNGQFNYPWDVAVSSNDDSIAISDTRNHRVQLFDTRGTFLNKFGFESSFFYKQFDSPRGLVFAPDGRLFCTDFNNHRLAVIDVVHNQMEFFGREGEYDGTFKRPQGLDMDLEGHLIIADSRNNRVQVFTPQLTFLCSFGIDGPPPRGRSIIDRPCDVCVCEGKIYVVDFGNNKIHIY